MSGARSRAARRGIVQTLVAALLGTSIASGPGARSAHAQPNDSAPTTTTTPTPDATAPTERAFATLPPLAPVDVLRVADGTPLALDEVLASVERHHPTIDGLEARLEAAEGLELAAQGGFDPLLEIRGSASPLGYYQYGRLDASVQQATPLRGVSFSAGWRIGRPLGDSYFPEYYGYDRTLGAGELRAGLSVPLLRDGSIDARRATLARAQLGVDVAEGELGARRIRLHLAASEAYFRWVGAGRRYVVVHALLALAEQRDAQIGQRVAAGAIAGIERLENRRAILERRGALVAAHRNLERAAIALAIYVRDARGEPAVPSPTRIPEDLAPPIVASNDEAAAIDAALANRPELARARAQRDAARITAELARNQVLPRLDVALGASIDLGDESDPVMQARLAPGVAEGRVTFSMPLALREPRGRLAAARAELAAIDAELELARDTVTLEVRDARSAVRAAEASVAVASANTEVAGMLAGAERARFDGGLTTLFFVNLREAAAAEAALREVDARAELALARAMELAVRGELGAGRR